MNTQTIIARALGFVVLLGMAACQKEDTAPRGPTPVLSTDADLGHGYVRRDGAIHFIGGGVTGTGADATRIDMPSPELLKKLVRHKFGPFKTAEGLDVDSFQALSEEYTLDKNRVYYKSTFDDLFIVCPLPKADPASFNLFSAGLVRDKNHVWSGDTILSGVDPATVEIINPAFTVIKDKDSVHYKYDQIRGADPASFKHIGSGYYADNKRIYWCLDPVPDADPATFEVVGDSFIAKDRNRIYRSGVPLPGYDVESFELILHNEAGFQIYSDKSGIHVNKMTFPRSRPGKVEIIDDQSVKTGELIHLVNPYQRTPVTLFLENGKLMAETPVYEPESRKAEGMITADVTADGLRNIRVSPLPGGGTVPEVPDWQMRVFKERHLVQRMLEAGKLLQANPLDL